MGSRQLSGITLVVAIVVLAQVGYVGYREKRRSAGMEQRIAEVEQRSRRSLDQLARDLERERQEAQLLLEQLRTSEDEAAQLATDLIEASSRVAVLERLTDERPALEIRLVPSDGLQRFLVTAHNPGRRPVHIRQTEGLVWLDEEAGGFGRSEQVVTVPPGGAAEFFEFSLLGQEPVRVGEGSMTFQAAVCFSFERTLRGLSNAWASQYLFEYNPGAATTAILRHEVWADDGPDSGCQLASAQL